MTGRLGPRRSVSAGTGRRVRPVRRRSRLITPARAGAALVALASAGAIYGASASSAFDYARLRLDPSPSYTNPADVEAALANVRGQNLFRLDTAPLVATLTDLRTVAAARVAVELPDTLVVHVEERVPILVWQVGERRYLSDASGLLFAKLDDPVPAGAAALPVIVDHRAASAGLSIGVALDRVALDAATRLASLVPADVGSTADTLSIALTDENGFVMRTRPSSWSAIFGFYTASIRTPALIPDQVRLLRSLLDGREATVDRVILASATNGTFTSKTTPTPSGSAKPPASAKPSATPDASDAPTDSPRPDESADPSLPLAP